MKLEKLLADKFLYTSTADELVTKHRLRPAVRLTTVGIALGVCVILLSFFIVAGFKEEIRSKVNGLIGSLVISNPDNVYGQYTIPLSLSPDAWSAISATVKEYDQGASLFTFVDEMALLKSDSAFSGVLLHGVDSLYNRDFFASYLTDGRLPDFRKDSAENEILISSYLANNLGLGLGDEIMSYFTSSDETGQVEGGVKMRRLKVTGIFNTGFEDYDRKMVIGDASMLRSVRGWDDDNVSGIMVQLRGGTDPNPLYEDLFALLADRYAHTGERYAMNKAEELSNGLLDWLSLLDANVLLILFLLTAVAGMTMITGIIVLVLEKVKAIATLKALGQGNRSLKGVFRQMSLYILLKGLAWGNTVALVLAGVQYLWHPLTLDASQYYMNYVPVKIDLLSILWGNLIIFAVIYLLVLVPVLIISRIRPSESLRFE